MTNIYEHINYDRTDHMLCRISNRITNFLHMRNLMNIKNIGIWKIVPDMYLGFTLIIGDEKLCGSEDLWFW